MPFNGPLLAARVVQALAAIPGAIKDLKSLLTRPHPNIENANEKLNWAHQISVCSLPPFPQKPPRTDFTLR